MKTFYTILISFLLLPLAIFSQSITNGNFESWTTGAFGFYTFSIPTDWGTCNDEAALIGTTPIQKVDGYNDFGILLESKRGTIYEIEIAGIIANGELGLNLLTTPPAVIIKGVPFTSRPSNLNFYYKYEPVIGDNCYAEVILSKEGTEVGKGTFTQSNTVSSWTQGSIAINYSSSETPDTLLILFQSSNNPIAENGINGSKLYLDDVSFANLSVQKFSDSEQFKIYPLPATTSLYISLKNPANANIMLSNLVGQTIINKSVKNMTTEKIDISKLNKGIYILTLQYANQSFSRKITVD